VLRAVEGVREFKIIQWSVGHLEVLVVPGPAWQDGAKEGIVAQLRRRMESPVRVEINLVDDIPPESSGKHRYVVSHVGLPDRLGMAA
jgi:phenylacetate-CoA ligase